MKQVASAALCALVRPLFPSGARLVLVYATLLAVAPIVALAPEKLGWSEVAAVGFALYMLAADARSLQCVAVEQS